MGVATGNFQYTNGSPVANGLFQWKLSNDAILGTSTAVCVAPPVVDGILDTAGFMSATIAFNDVLTTTSGESTYYQLTVKGANGEQVWNEYYSLTGTAANLNLTPPGGPPIVVTTPVASVLLQTNSVTNDVQTKENLVAGTNVTLSYSAGSTTINAAGGTGGGATFSAAGYGYFVGPGWTSPMFQSGSFGFGPVTGTGGV